MPKDIRAYFSPGGKKAKQSVESKSRPLVILSSDEEDGKKFSPKKEKHKNGSSEKTKGSSKEKRSKKRTIESSDEDEVNVIQVKKAKLSNKKKSTQAEEILNEVTDPFKVLNAKPVKRINAPQIPKKNVKKEFVIADDDFDTTLGQLDSSIIEDNYIASVGASESPFFKDKKSDQKDKPSGSKNKEKGTSSPNKNEIKSKDSSESKDSPQKNKIQDDISTKNHGKSSPKNIKLEKDEKSEKQHEKRNSNKEKKSKDSSTWKMEVNKDDKPHKNKTKGDDYNNVIDEKIKEKHQHAVLYQNYLNRGGARNPGSKEIPEGAEQCLANLSFLVTGVLESLEREEAENLIKQYGGKVLHSVSRKLNYLIVGEEAGPSKLTKADSFGIKKISEDDLLEMLRTRPAGVESKTTFATDKKSKSKINKSQDNTSLKNTSSSEMKESSEFMSPKANNKSSQKSKISNEEDKQSSVEQNSTMTKDNTLSVNKDIKEIKQKESLISDITNKLDNSSNPIEALVEKYRPKEIKQIIGQGTDKSNAKKLEFWLQYWFSNHKDKDGKKRPKFVTKNDTGAIYKAALLSGPPGVGKTTTAYVICAQLGYEVLEFNASDTRSKRLLQEEIAGIISNKTVRSFLTNKPTAKTNGPKHVLLMDEVDGMAGNEDRGGMQELIAFIKSTEVPIICICNDRQSPKIRTLANYTFDLRFQKPRVEQIRGAMMSMCYKEGIKVTPDEVTQIIHSTNQDIRQVINHLAILAAKARTEEENKGKASYKNLKLGPWDVVRKVFTAEEHKNMSIHDKSDLFFHDYNISGLFVQENYLSVTPNGSRTELYKKLANCSESLAIGDAIENMIRSKQAWGLLPVQACFSSVIPGSVMSGYINSQINFPSWLGKNSKSKKLDRLLQDITVHARITTGASKEAINLDYAKMLVDSIVRPLAIEGVEGVEKAIEVMNQYHLTREDLDSLIELTQWPNTRDPMQSVDTKTKSAFTRAYNKTSLYSTSGTMKKKSARDIQDQDFLDDEEGQESDSEDEDKIESDKLIKAKISKRTDLSSNKKENSKTSKAPKKPATTQTKKK